SSDVGCEPCPSPSVLPTPRVTLVAPASSRPRGPARPFAGVPSRRTGTLRAALAVGVGAFLLLIPGQAQAIQPLQEFLAAGRQRNLELAVARADAEAERPALRQANLGLTPTVAVNAGYT